MSRTRKNLKWIVICLNLLFIFCFVFSGNLIFLIITNGLFLLYIILDKYKKLVKTDDLSRLYKKDKI